MLFGHSAPASPQSPLSIHGRNTAKRSGAGSKCVIMELAIPGRRTKSSVAGGQQRLPRWKRQSRPPVHLYVHFPWAVRARGTLVGDVARRSFVSTEARPRSEEHTSELQSLR